MYDLGVLRFAELQLGATDLPLAPRGEPRVASPSLVAHPFAQIEEAPGVGRVLALEVRRALRRLAPRVRGVPQAAEVARIDREAERAGDGARVLECVRPARRVRTEVLEKSLCLGELARDRLGGLGGGRRHHAAPFSVDWCRSASAQMSAQRRKVVPLP